MHKPFPSLNALRAFEAAARHLSLSKAAQELHVSAGALSHQIRGLEEFLGLKLFERRVRSISLTPPGEELYRGLEIGFSHIRDAVQGLSKFDDPNTFVISAPPGFTSKWLAPRLHRFSSAYPKINTQVSSCIENANFRTDGVDVAVRNQPADAEADPELVVEKLTGLSFAPVLSPSLTATLGPVTSPEALKGLPLIHNDIFSKYPEIPAWADWFKAAGVSGVDSSSGLRFNSPDHAIDATLKGAGVLLSPDVLAYDGLREGRLIMPFEIFLHSPRAYYIVCAKRQQNDPRVQAFRSWIKREMEALGQDKRDSRNLECPPDGSAV